MLDKEQVGLAAGCELCCLPWLGAGIVLGVSGAAWLLPGVVSVTWFTAGPWLEQGTIPFSLGIKEAV